MTPDYRGLWYLKQHEEPYLYELEDWSRCPADLMETEEGGISSFWREKFSLFSSEHFPIVVVDTFRGKQRWMTGRWFRILLPQDIVIPRDPRFRLIFWSDGTRWTTVWER